MGYRISVNELINETERDVLFYEEPDGGVTFSGGEPLLQSEFIVNILKGCHLREIHTCVGTTAYVKAQNQHSSLPQNRPAQICPVWYSLQNE